jgi:hypothetical protein
MQLILCIPPVRLIFTTSSYSSSLTGATEQLGRGEIFLEHQDIVVLFYAHTMAGSNISRLEKSKVDKYLQEIRIGSQCLRSNLDLLQRRYKAGFMGSSSVDRVEENLEEAASICDDTIDSTINLHMAM